MTDQQTPPIWISGAKDMDRAQQSAFVEFRAEKEIQTVTVIDGGEERAFDRGESQQQSNW